MASPVRQSRRGVAARRHIPGGLAGAAARRRSARAGMIPSGVPMPVGNLNRPGGIWRMVYSNDFLTDVALGTWPATAPAPGYEPDLVPYNDGWTVTGGFGPSQYWPSLVLSVNGSILRKHLRVNAGIGLAAAIGVYPGGISGSPGPNQLYGRYTVRWRCTSVVGWHLAWLLWPASGLWPQDGEIDFPEAETDDQVYAFMHRQNGVDGSDQDGYGPVGPVGQNVWHTSTIEWLPNDLKFILDGQLVGNSTSRVPNTPMQWAIQTDTSYDRTPASTATCTVEIDWIAMYASS